MSNSEEHPIQEQEDTHPATPGKYLRQVRKGKDLSVEVVAEATKISISNIRAIEEEAYEKLPADTFVRGLITLYCNFLGIDSAKIAAEFLAKREGTSPATRRQGRIKEESQSSSLTAKKFAEPSHISSATIALALLAVIALSVTGLSLYTSWNPFAFLPQKTENMQTSMQGIFNSNKEQETDAKTTTPPPHEQQKQPWTADVVTEKQAAGIALNPQAAVTGQQFSYNLSALFLQDSEVTIRIDGQNPVRKTFKNGEMASWRATQSLQIVFDKPGAATLTLNDAALPFPVPESNQPPTLLLPDDILDQ